MAYTISNPQLGQLPIGSTDAGIIPPNNANTGSTTTIPTPPLAVGQIVQAIDPTYGAGEFILLLGVAANTVGSLVTYNQLTGITTLCPSTANLAQPLAVSMTANTSTTTWSWYQIDGVAVIKKSAVIFAPSSKVYIGTTGRVTSLSTSGKQLLAARSVNASSVVSATSTVAVLINRVHAQGQIT